MAQTLTCDSCEQPVDTNDRAQILIFTPSLMADPTFDLCADCSRAVKKDARVQKAMKKARQRVLERNAAQMGISYSEYLESLGPDAEELRGDLTKNPPGAVPMNKSTEVVRGDVTETEAET